MPRGGVRATVRHIHAPFIPSEGSPCWRTARRTRCGNHYNSYSPRLALRIGEAAAALSISRSKMYGLIKRGKVRTVLVGDVMRIRVSDLENYLTDLPKNKSEKIRTIGS
jgi:excisionase family DNA binding protein